MIRNKDIWERYEKGEIIEQTPGLEPAQPKFGAELINQVETDIMSFNPSVLENIINSFEKKRYSDVNTHLGVLKNVESSAQIAENKGLEYLYGYIIPIIKAGHGLDSYVGAKTNSIAERFNDSYSSLQKSRTTADTKIYQQLCRSDSELLSSLVDLADERSIEVKINSKTSKLLHEYRAWSIKCDNIDTKINTLIEAYRSLDMTQSDIKVLRKLRKPVSKSLGLFKGHLLKKCSSLDYVAGMELCDKLSEEMKYAQENLGQVYNIKRDLLIKLEVIQELSKDIRSYAVPLSTLQLKKLTGILTRESNSSGLIYLGGIEEELKIISESNRDTIQTVIDNQKLYVLGLQNNLSRTLGKSVSDFQAIDSVISEVELGRQQLEQYKPQLELLKLNPVETDNLITQSKTLYGNLVDSRDAYNILIKNSKLLDALETEVKKYGVSETRLNELGALLEKSRAKSKIPINTLKKSYESEHESYKNKAHLILDNIIDKVDELASNTNGNSNSSTDILKYYEKINTFKDISEKVRNYKNIAKPAQQSKRPIFEVAKPIPAIIVNKTSLVDQLKMLEFPTDDRYLVIDDVLRGKTYSNGWIDKMNQLNAELDKLKLQKNLAKTDYVLKVAGVIDGAYHNGYLNDIADIDNNKNILESTINKLYEFGRSVAKA
jgi:hypothetical protein